MRGIDPRDPDLQDRTERHDAQRARAEARPARDPRVASPSWLRDAFTVEDVRVLADACRVADVSGVSRCAQLCKLLELALGSAEGRSGLRGAGTAAGRIAAAISAELPGLEAEWQALLGGDAW